MKRLAFEDWEIVRHRILVRDEHACQYCGATRCRLEVDHIQPISKGGGNEESNLVTACFKCNRAKRARLLSEWMPDHHLNNVVYLFGLWFVKEATLNIAKANLGNETNSVLMFLLGNINSDNLVQIKQTEIAVALNMYRQQVNRAMSRLLQDGIILRVFREGIKVGYRFNPNYCWRGSAKNHIVALKDHRPVA